MSVVHVSGALFMDSGAISAEDILTEAPKDWFPGLSLFNIYPYGEFSSLERAYYGLAAVKGEPASKWLASAATGTMEMENPAPLTEFSEALELLEEERDHLFEDSPFVEVKREEDYNRALAVILNLEIPRSIKAWSPIIKKKLERESSWMGPGVYDFRDEPPSHHADTVAAYEIEGLGFEADNIIEYMFQGDEWKNTLREVIQDLREEV